jgi:hypothetical protein
MPDPAITPMHRGCLSVARCAVKSENRRIDADSNRRRQLLATTTECNRARWPSGVGARSGNLKPSARNAVGDPGWVSINGPILALIIA